MRTALAAVVLLTGVAGADAPKPAPPPGSLPPIPPLKADPVAWTKADPTDPSAKPDPKALKAEVEKLLQLRAEADKPAAEQPQDERTRLRNKLDELVEKLDKQKAAPPKSAHPPTTPHDPPPSRPALPDGGKPIDAVRSAANFFRIGEAEQAYQMLRGLEDHQLPKEDQAFAEYLRAACLRKMGKTTDALALYRSVAANPADPFLVEHAKVQITAIRSAQDFEAKLEQLKGKRNPK